jgi:hypothetical protein
MERHQSERNSSSGPDQVLGEQTDIEAANPAASNDGPKETANSPTTAGASASAEVETDPLGGTGGVGAGGAG